MESVNKEEVKGGRERLRERLGGKYPDKSFDDDEALDAQIYDDYDDYEGRLGEYQKREEALSELFTSDPRSANFLQAWQKGGDPLVEFVREFGEDIREAIDDPEKQEEIAKAHQEYLERISRSKALEEEYEQNLAETLKMLEAMREEKGLTEDEMDEGWQVLSSMTHDMIMGKVSRETMERALKAVGYDNDVARASAEGEVRGRNARIEEKLKKDRGGDGLPAGLGGSNTPGVKPKMPSLGALDRYGDDHLSIWERGGMKRTKHK